MILYETFFKDATSLTIRTNYFIDVFKNSTKLDVTAIAVDQKEKISIGDRVYLLIKTPLEKPYNTYYVANKIYPDVRFAIINEFEQTDTTLFILPLLGIDMRILLLKSNFVNGYIANSDNYNEIGDCVYIVYRYMPFKQYKDLMHVLAAQSNFISCEKDSDKRFDIVKMSIPEKFKESVKLIFDGKYTEIPEKIKNLIVKMSFRKKDDIIYQTLFNGEELRKTMAYNLGINVDTLPENLREKPNLKKETW